MPDKLLTTREVGQLIGGRTDYWVRGRCRDGDFKAVKDGNEWLIAESEVQRWINERTIQRVAKATRTTGNWVVDEVERRRRERRGKQAS